MRRRGVGSGWGRCRVSGEKSTERRTRGASTNLGRDQIADEHEVERHALRGEHHGTEQGAGVAHGHECEQVHALVLGLLQQRVDPCFV